MWIGYRWEATQISPHAKLPITHALFLELSVEKSNRIENNTLQECIPGIKNI